MQYYLGADGGGTKTTLSVCDENGRVIYTANGGSVNYYSEGLAGARENMLDAMRDISAYTGISRFRCVFIGMSALSGRATENELHAFADGIFNADAVHMDSDVYIALAATLQSGVCAAAIAGTGSMLAARTESGRIITRGGHGYILGDEGSAYRIAEDALRLAVRSLENTEPQTVLTGAAFRFFGVSDTKGLVDLIYGEKTDRKVIASFAREVGKCAVEGDGAANAILRKQALLFSKTALSLLGELPAGTPLAVYGGVFEHDRIFTSAFAREIGIFGSEIYLLPVPPVRGALLCAFREAEGGDETGFIANICC